MYSPPRFLFNAHLETIYPTLCRSIELKEYEHERISTPDDDFLDLYWLRQHSKKVVILSHGLEGNAHRAYIKGMAKVFHENGFDVLAWNYRGCGDEMNRTLRFYHSGATDDLDTVTNHVVRQGYNDIFLIGFSLGGNLTLKYMGERAVPLQIKGAVTFSVPIDLYTSSLQISRPSNWIYSTRFLRSLKKKIKAKAKSISGLNTEGLEKITSLQEFDNRYTGPLHGYKDAIDYYHQCSAIRFLENIKVPSLIVNAANDPFLSKECFPEKITNPMVQFESPARGGHVGFSQFNGKNIYWSDQRALDFVQSIL